MLYKYRQFSDLTVSLLIADQLFFANPGTFNDPLDVKPSLDIDLNADELKGVLRCLVEQRIHAETSAALKTIKYRDQETFNHIKIHSRQQADEVIAGIDYDASNPCYEEFNPEYTINDITLSLLGSRIEDELCRRYDKGIVSFAGRSECSLMWSHYGDQHKGVCLGYSAPNGAGQDLYEVTYGGERLLKASTVAAMLDGDAAAGCQVDQVVLSQKGQEWSYEDEWRLIGLQGVHASPLELKEVVFGMRCPHEIRYVIVKALADLPWHPEFYEICGHHKTFQISRYKFCVDELISSFPRSMLALRKTFSGVIIPQMPQRDDA